MGKEAVFCIHLSNSGFFFSERCRGLDRQERGGGGQKRGVRNCSFKRTHTQKQTHNSWKYWQHLVFACYPQSHSSHRGLDHKGHVRNHWYFHLVQVKVTPDNAKPPKNNYERRRCCCRISLIHLNVSRAPRCDSAQYINKEALPCRPWYPYLPWSQGSRLLPGKRIGGDKKRWGCNKGERTG